MNTVVKYCMWKCTYADHPPPRRAHLNPPNLTRAALRWDPEPFLRLTETECHCMACPCLLQTSKCLLWANMSFPFWVENRKWHFSPITGICAMGCRAWSLQASEKPAMGFWGWGTAHSCGFEYPQILEFMGVSGMWLSRAYCVINNQIENNLIAAAQYKSKKKGYKAQIIQYLQ